jgi:hypothetical protein
MTDWFDDIKTYLPKYLSHEARTDLFEELKQFPENIDGRLYTARLAGERVLYQGDGLASLWVADLPTKRIETARVMVLSNTCDTAADNKSILGPRILYCPIISFPKYVGLLEGNPKILGDGINDHLESIRKQRNSSMFYLPKNDRLGEEGIALLDRFNNCNAQAVDLDELVRNRLFTLSDYGFYVFLFKISIHLTRIREGVARN